MGDDGISVDMLRALDDFSIDVITDIENKVYDSGEIITHMKKSIFVNVPKKPGTVEGEKYKTSSVISHVAKIVLRII